jgi:hypothetical protein
MPKPDLSRVPEYYHRYINLVSEADLHKAFILHQQSLMNILMHLPAERWDYRYAPDKWTIKDLVQHIIDAERIFTYRALTIARNDSTPLPGFDEGNYVLAAEAHLRTPEDLLKELEVVQKASTLLFYSFNEQQLDRAGTANGNPVYVNGIGFIIIGHALHHVNILKERYGV